MGLEILVEPGYSRRIYRVRHTLVMLDRDLAVYFGVPVGIVNRAGKRAERRWRALGGRFRLTAHEALRLQFRSDPPTKTLHGGARWNPVVYTRAGVVMLCGKFRSRLIKGAASAILKEFERLGPNRYGGGGAR